MLSKREKERDSKLKENKLDMIYERDRERVRYRVRERKRTRVTEGKMRHGK